MGYNVGIQAQLTSTPFVIGIIAMVAGVILVAVGAAAFHPASIPAIVAGVAFLVVGLIMVIVSVVSGGKVP
jgi:hypothetical protein